MMFDENWALKQAVEIAKDSPCQSKRGVIIWSRTAGLISSGFNAPPKPFECDGTDACKKNCSKTAVHAEQKAIIDIGNQFIKLDQCEMLHVKVVNGEAVISDKPSCWQCSKLILASKLKSMWLYQKEGLVEYSPYEFHRQTLVNSDLH